MWRRSGRGNGHGSRVELPVLSLLRRAVRALSLASFQRTGTVWTGTTSMPSCRTRMLSTRTCRRSSLVWVRSLPWLACWACGLTAVSPGWACSRLALVLPHACGNWVVICVVCPMSCAHPSHRARQGQQHHVLVRVTFCGRVGVGGARPLGVRGVVEVRYRVTLCVDVWMLGWVGTTL